MRSSIVGTPAPRHAPRLVAAVAALLLTGCGGAEPTIGPGQESFFGELLAGALAEPCRWTGASVRGDRVEATYRCSDAEGDLHFVLAPPGWTKPAEARTGKFRVLAPGVPARHVEALAERVRLREGAFDWQWTLAGEAGRQPTLVERGAARLGLRWRGGPRGAGVVVAAAWMVALGLLGRSRRREGRVPPIERRDPIGPLAVGAAVVLVGWLALAVSRFSFRSDDYAWLLGGAVDPFHLDQDVRFLSVTLPFALSSRLGDPPLLFALANLACALTAMLLLRALALRAGLGRGEALLGAALFTLAPGYPLILTWASGLQHAAALPLVLSVLLAFDEALRSDGPEHRLRRLGMMALGLALAGTGVFVKYAMMVLVPPSCWVWATFVRRRAPGWAMHPVSLAVASAVAVAVPFALSMPIGAGLGQVSHTGVGNVGVNVGPIARELARAAAPVALAAVLLLVAARLSRPAGTSSREPSERAPRLGLLALAVVFFVPFLLNVRYSERYYGVAAWAWLSLLFAPVLHGAAARLTGVLRLAAPIALALLLPYRELALQDEAVVHRSVHPTLLGLRRATAGTSSPCRVEIMARCDDEAATARSKVAFDAFWLYADLDLGIRWATGYYPAVIEPVDVAVTRPGRSPTVEAACAGTARLRFCEGQGFTLER